MKVLVTGRCIPTQPDRCTGQQLAEGFRQAGHECVFYGCFYGEPNNFLGVKGVQGADFDLVVVTEMNDGMWGYESLFNYYRLKDVPRLYWDFDVSYHPDVSFARAGKIAYDGYLVGNRFFVDDFARRFGKPSLLLPYACSPTIHRRKPEILKTDILGFVGSMTPEREQLLQSVRCVQGVFGEALINATNQLYTMVHINQDACKGLVPGRPLESTGCGTTLLMDRSSYEDFVEFLPQELHECIFVFDGADDIQKWMFEWSEKLPTLEGYGERIQQYMYQHHTYRNRAESIIAFAKTNDLL